MNESRTSDPLLTPKQVAAEFGEFFGEPRLRQWRYRGFGPPACRIGKRCLYRRSDVAAWIDANVSSSPGAK
jgi:hypothetical protein